MVQGERTRFDFNLILVFILSIFNTSNDTSIDIPEDHGIVTVRQYLMRY